MTSNQRCGKQESSQMNNADILAALVLLNTGNTLIQETRKGLMELEALPAPHEKHKKKFE